MPNRYFYTDALKAAWMAREFGFKIYQPADDIYHEELLSFDGLIDACNDEFAHAATPPYYVNPDSYPLLLPQVGDLITVNNGGSASLVTHEEFLLQLNAMLHQLVAPPQIIQRQGKAFFAPEEEAGE